MSELILLLTIFASTIIATLFLVIVFLVFTLSLQIFRPTVIALIVGVAVVFLGETYAHLVPQGFIRYYTIPLVLAAFSGGLSIRRQEWDRFSEADNQIPISRKRDGLTVFAVVLGAASGALSSVGKPMLLALDYDVIGNTPDEIRDVRIAGAVFGGLVGAFSVLLLWVSISRMIRKQ